MSTVRAICLLAVMAAGCGQRLPENYGIYIREGTTWRSLDQEQGEHFTSMQSVPEFLLFDRRLQGSGDVQDVVKLNVTKWTRKTIEVVVAAKDAPPVKYTSASASGFVTLDSQIPFQVSPVQKHVDMVVVRPSAPLPLGLYRLSVLGKRYLLDHGITPKDPASLPTTVQVDKWYRTVSDKNGFSWDGWMAMTQKGPGDERTYRDRGVIEVSYRDVGAFDNLVAELDVQFKGLAATPSIPEMVAFCSSVSELDRGMYDQRIAETLSVAKRELQSRTAASDWPFVLGNCEVLIANGIRDAELDELHAKSKTALQEADDKAIAALRKLVAHKGKEVATHQYRDVDNGHDLSLAIMDGGLAFQEWISDSTVDSWIGMAGLAWIRKDKDRNFLNGRVTYRIWVGCDYCFNSHGGGSCLKIFGFQGEAERDAAFDQIAGAHNKWLTENQGVLKRSIEAPSAYWSPRIPICDLAYTLTGASETADVQVQSPGDNDYVLEGGKSYESCSFRSGTEWIRLKSTGAKPVRIELELCPSSRTAWRGESANR